jgi:hypothetical protein
MLKAKIDSKTNIKYQAISYPYFICIFKHWSTNYS